eukprot:jgi/Pico_ML_1/52527/g3218.t1
MNPLLAQFHELSKLSMQRNATWTLSNFCRGKPAPVSPSPVLHCPTWEVDPSNDEEVLTDACWALSYLSDGPHEFIQETQTVINCNALPCLLLLLTNNYKKSIKKEACWTISNITAGNREQIQAIIDANIIPPLVSLLATAEFDVKKEAAGQSACNIRRRPRADFIPS